MGSKNPLSGCLLRQLCIVQAFLKSVVTTFLFQDPGKWKSLCQSSYLRTASTVFRKQCSGLEDDGSDASLDLVGGTCGQGLGRWDVMPTTRQA